MRSCVACFVLSHACSHKLSEAQGHRLVVPSLTRLVKQFVDGIFVSAPFCEEHRTEVSSHTLTTTSVLVRMGDRVKP